jgi:pyruvate formate lyase activating enzyme
MENLVETEGIIFKIKRFSIHDGPGIRTSVFLKGCPLNCIWCHSPEGISSEITIWYDKSLCITCGECVKSCPNKAITLLNDPDSQIKIDRQLCCLSGECVSICPTGAIQYTGLKITLSGVMSEIEKDMLYYTNSGGGVTLTGGEPLNQPEFSGKILEECRRLNIHTAIESCLFCERGTINNVIDFVDLFIVDMKLFDEARHIIYTGKPNDIIKDNLRYLSESGKSILVRIPMIKNITDTEENKTAIRDFISSIDSGIPIEYLSYNPLAENNYKRLGIQYLLK